MKIVMPGGTGNIGALLIKAFADEGHTVVVLSRSPSGAACRIVVWDGMTLDDWMHEIDGADVVLNLAGHTVNCRYTPENRKKILESRVNSTRVIGQAIQKASKPPALWLQMSTATIYAHRFDKGNDEATGIIGGRERDIPSSWKFSGEVARAWEKTCLDARTPHTRRVLMRSSSVMMHYNATTFDVLLRLVNRGVGGTQGSGKQYVSWIHEKDFTSAVLFLLEKEKLEGPVNLTSPHPIPNAEFMRQLRAAWGASYGLQVPTPVLQAIMKLEAEHVLRSRFVLPGVLTSLGFKFEFLHWEDAARDLVRRWRQANSILANR
ncbi:MAG: TIGR01777 family oxidoreductase [Capsulimonadaceae bacterium]